MVVDLSQVNAVVLFVGAIIAVAGPAVASYYGIKAGLSSLKHDVEQFVSRVSASLDALTERIEGIERDLYKGNGQPAIKSATKANADAIADLKTGVISELREDVKEIFRALRGAPVTRGREVVGTIDRERELGLWVPQIDGVPERYFLAYHEAADYVRGVFGGRTRAVAG